MLGQLAERHPHRLLVRGRRELACVRVVDQEAEHLGGERDRGRRGRTRGGEASERLALVVDRHLRRSRIGRPREQDPTAVIDRQASAERAVDRGRELAQLPGGYQTSKLDRIIERPASGHPPILSVVTPTCSARA